MFRTMKCLFHDESNAGIWFAPHCKIYNDADQQNLHVIITNNLSNNIIVFKKEIQCTIIMIILH